MKEIDHAVAAVGRRLWALRLYEAGARATVLGAVVLVPLAIANALWGLGLPGWSFLVLLGGLALGGVGWAWRKRPTSLEAALGIDRSLGLEERMSSALTLGEAQHPIEAALIADAIARARAVKPREVVPFSSARELRVLACCALAVLVTANLEQVGLAVVTQARSRPDPGKAHVAQRLAAEPQRRGPPSTSRARSVKDLIGDLQVLSEDYARAETDLDLARVQGQIEALRLALKRLAEPVAPPRALGVREGELTRTLREALAAQEFRRAAKEANRLAQQSAELPPADPSAKGESTLRRLAAELEALAKELGEAPALAKQLRSAADASRSPERNPDAKRALERVRDLLEERARVQELEDLLEESAKEVARARAARAGAAPAEERDRFARDMPPPRSRSGEFARASRGYGTEGEEDGLQTEAREAGPTSGRRLQVRGRSGADYQPSGRSLTERRERAMSDQKIPRHLVGYVKDYLESLQEIEAASAPRAPRAPARD